MNHHSFCITLMLSSSLIAGCRSGETSPFSQGTVITPVEQEGGALRFHGAINKNYKALIIVVDSPDSLTNQKCAISINVAKNLTTLEFPSDFKDCTSWLND